MVGARELGKVIECRAKRAGVPAPRQSRKMLLCLSSHRGGEAGGGGFESQDDDDGCGD